MVWGAWCPSSLGPFSGQLPVLCLPQLPWIRWKLPPLSCCWSECCFRKCLCFLWYWLWCELSGGRRIIGKNEEVLGREEKKGHCTQQWQILPRDSRLLGTWHVLLDIILLLFFLIVFPILWFFHVQSFFRTQQKRELTSLSLFNTKPSKSYFFVTSSFFLFRLIWFINNSVN